MSVGTTAVNDPELKALGVQLRILRGQPDLISTTIVQLTDMIGADQAAIAVNTAQIVILNAQEAARIDEMVALGDSSATIVADPAANALAAQITALLASNNTKTAHIAQVQSMIDAQNAQLALLPAQQAAVEAQMVARLDVIRGI